MKKPAYFLALLILLSSVFNFASQAQERKGWSPQAKGAVIGGLGGAAAGAIIHKRNRPVGGVVGGVAGAGVGYAIGKHRDNKNKERARIAAANRAAAYRAEQRRTAIARQSSANRARPAVAANSLAPAASSSALLVSAEAPSSAFLPNNAVNDPSHPYATSEVRRKSW